MGENLKSYRAATVDMLRSRLIAGLLFLTPFAITIAVFSWVYSVVANSVRPALSGQPGYVVPLVVIAMLVLLPLLLGLFMLVPPVRQSLYSLGTVMKVLPVIGSIYKVGEGVATAVDPETHRGLNRVVRVEYPRKGIWSLGFLTAEIEMDEGEKWAVVFLPTAPMPNSGWVALVPLQELYEVDITASDAMTITLSAGMLAPKKVSSRQLSAFDADDGQAVVPSSVASDESAAPVAGA